VAVREWSRESGKKRKSGLFGQGDFVPRLYGQARQRERTWGGNAKSTHAQQECEISGRKDQVGVHAYPLQEAGVGAKETDPGAGGVKY